MKFRESVIPFWNAAHSGCLLDDANCPYSELQESHSARGVAGIQVIAVLPTIPSSEGGHGLTRYSIAAGSDCACRRAHFSGAADRLHIGQSTLSKQIFRLEGEIGFQLFVHNHQVVEITDAGRAFVEEARRRSFIRSGLYCRGERFPMELTTSSILGNRPIPTLFWFRRSYPFISRFFQE
jgi:hypothetical protein